MSNRGPSARQSYPSPQAFSPARCGYFLDLDGTLLEISQLPNAVTVAPALRRLIDQLYGAAGGAVALISGRSIVDIDRLFARPKLAVAGQHGAERRDVQGKVHVAHSHQAALDELRARISRWCLTHPEILIEDKGLSIALHYRNAPALEQALGAFVLDLTQTLNGVFSVQRGKMVFDIRPACFNKGLAIEQFLSESPFAGRLPVFVGDDVTDEDGFMVINRCGGVSIKVGDGDSAAQYRFAGVGDVHRWLRELLGDSPHA